MGRPLKRWIGDAVAPLTRCFLFCGTPFRAWLRTERSDCISEFLSCSVSGKAPLVTLFTKEGCSTGERASRVQLTESSTTQSSVFQAPAAGSYALAGSAQTHATAVLSSQTLDGGSRQPPARPGHGPVKHLQVADGAISCDFTPRLSPRRSSDASARSTPDDTPGKTDQANSASLGSDASEQDGDSSATKSDEAQQSSGRIALTHDWTVSSLYSIQTAQQDGPVSGQKTALSVLQVRLASSVAGAAK